MATTKKTDSGKPAAKQSAARKPAAKKTAAKKAAAKKPAAKKAAETQAVKPAKKVSAAKTRAKAERKAPEKVPGRKERRGVVVSDAMDKTIVVRIDVAQKHERYGKVVRRSSKLHVARRAERGRRRRSRARRRDASAERDQALASSRDPREGQVRKPAEEAHDPG